MTERVNTGDEKAKLLSPLVKIFYSETDAKVLAEVVLETKTPEK